MAETRSLMIPLGTKAAPFNLRDTVSDKLMTLEDVKGDKGTVVLFICNHCPYVKLINDSLVGLARQYMQRGVGFVAISSNDAAQYPDDGPAQMKEAAKKLGYPFPYLYDETQEVAKSYDAACTPDIYVLDANMRLVYRGQFDDARPGKNQPVTGKDLSNALDLMLTGKAVPTDQRPSVGCNIKWKKVIS